MKREIKKVLSLILALFLIVSPLKVNAYDNYGEKFQDIMDIIEENYYDKSQVEKEKLFKVAVEAMLNSLDPYSNYMPGDDFERFMDMVNNEYVGIGVVLNTLNGRVVVESVMAQGPAFKAGLKANDIIDSVNGEDVSTYSINKVGALTRGEQGTKVSIGVSREGKKLKFDIVREKIALLSAWEKDIKDLLPSVRDSYAKKIGYIKVDSFSESVQTTVRLLLEKMKEEGKKDIILDLRDNGGGSVFSAYKVAEHFTNRGGVVVLEDNQGVKHTYLSNGSKGDKNVVVLINGNSASASEFVAGAIQESGGKLVGETTFGKGIAQTFYELEDGDNVKLSFREFYTAGGNHIHKKGIKPDYEVKFPKIMDIGFSFHIGDRYKEVKILEENLQFLGYNIVVADDYYDKNTADIIEQIQAENKMYPYGVYDKTSQKLINKLLLEKFRLNDIQLKKAVEVLIENME